MCLSIYRYLIYSRDTTILRDYLNTLLLLSYSFSHIPTNFLLSYTLIYLLHTHLRVYPHTFHTHSPSLIPALMPLISPLYYFSLLSLSLPYSPSLLVTPLPSPLTLLTSPLPHLPHIRLLLMYDY